jgi:nicotinate-nucleotide--dimethylbenzimidazole phosphoribosyltransferase
MVIADDRLRSAIGRIRPVDMQAAAAMQRRLDAKTKPRGSLGRIEELCCRIASIRGTPAVEPLPAAIVVVAADHGVAAEGVSAYPAEVTAQMLRAFVSGRAAISVLAREARARLVVVDAGVDSAEIETGVRDERIRRSTRNSVAGAAMTAPETMAAVRAGVGLAEELAADGVGVLALGDMGIGNTTASAAVTAALLGRDAAEVCGRGTGIGDDVLHHKIDVVRRALDRNRPGPTDPIGTLASVGGYEIATLAGIVLGAAATRTVPVIDGFITAAAALVAARLAPAAAPRFVASHRSPEPGHAMILEELGLDPLLDLDLRLGEGSGAALALPLIRSALALACEMGPFEDMGVTDTGA